MGVGGGGSGGGGSGGGSTTTPKPVQASLTADLPGYLIGDRASLTARFASGTARLEPGLGIVRDGDTVQTPPLDGLRTYQLVVQNPGQADVVVTLDLSVRYRNTYVAAGNFISAYHATVSLADGSLLVTGGDRAGAVYSDAVDRFDPATRQFTRAGTLLTGRGLHTASLLLDGRILIVGGQTVSASGPSSEVFDLTTGRSTEAGTLNRSRTGHTATVLADGRVLVVGGTNIKTAELWDPSQRSWRAISMSLQHDRVSHTATRLADGRVLIAGGATSSRGHYVFAEVFAPRSESFTPLETGISTAYAGQISSVAADGSVLLFGGEDSQSADSAAQASVLRFDPLTARFTRLADLATARAQAAGTPLSDGSVILIGGRVLGQRDTRSGTHWWRAASEEPLVELPSARLWHTVDRLPDGRLLILGGETADGALVGEVLIYQ